MKKLALTSILALFAVSAANAGTFDSTYRVKAGDFNGQFGAAFTTGANKNGDELTDFTAGDFGVTGVKLAYGISDSFALTFDVSSVATSYLTTVGLTGTNPEIGINWQLVNTPSFGLDLIAKYGMALTEIAGTDTRIGMNNLQAGAHLYGAADALQWGATALAQYTFVPDTVGDGDAINLLLQAEVMYAMNANWDLKAEVMYNMYNLNNGLNDAVDFIIYDRSVAFGPVYNFSETAAVMPYLSYHFQTVQEYDSTDVESNDNFWQVGAKFSVQF